MDEKFAKKAHALALKIREKAYAPYSKFKVGSVVQLEGSEELYSGHNIENASFPGCICAERVALYKALSEYKISKIARILLVTDNQHYDVPCGFCLQVLGEFSTEKTEVYLANLEGVQKVILFHQLLPETFTGESLPQK